MFQIEFATSVASALGGDAARTRDGVGVRLRASGGAVLESLETNALGVLGFDVLLHGETLPPAPEGPTRSPGSNVATGTSRHVRAAGNSPRGALCSSATCSRAARIPVRGARSQPCIALESAGVSSHCVGTRELVGMAITGRPMALLRVAVPPRPAVGQPNARAQVIRS